MIFVLSSFCRRASGCIRWMCPNRVHAAAIGAQKLRSFRMRHHPRRQTFPNPSANLLQDKRSCPRCHIFICRVRLGVGRRCKYAKVLGFTFAYILPRWCWKICAAVASCNHILASNQETEPGNSPTNRGARCRDGLVDWAWWLSEWAFYFMDKFRY